MRIEIGPAVCLSQLDTVVIASDGLFDNLSIQEVVGSMRKGMLTPFRLINNIARELSGFATRRFVC